MLPRAAILEDMSSPTDAAGSGERLYFRQLLAGRDIGRNDPIARQFVPSVREFETTPEENADPIGDDAHSPVEGIVHRYPDRVLLKIVNVCAVY